MAARRRQRHILSELQNDLKQPQLESQPEGNTVSAALVAGKKAHDEFIATVSTELATAVAPSVQRRVTRASCKAASTAQPPSAPGTDQAQNPEEQDGQPSRKRARTQKGTVNATSATQHDDTMGAAHPSSAALTIVTDIAAATSAQEMEVATQLACHVRTTNSAKHKGGSRKRALPQGVEVEAGGIHTGAEDGVCTVAVSSKSKKSKEVTVSAGGGATRLLEQQLWDQGYSCVVGIDEAGRGPLAGPVVAAACVIPSQVSIPGVADSKQLSEEERELLYETITQTPGVIWAVHVVDHTSIDRINILQATLLAMREAAQKLPPGQASYILVDGNKLPKDLPAPGRAVIKGDALCYCIAAASILAKVTRDRLMLEYHKQYPQYGFDKHKGYAVPAHYTALASHGPCDIHRRSFQPIRGMTGWTREAQLAEEQAAAGKGAGDAAAAAVAAATRDAAPDKCNAASVSSKDGQAKGKRGRKRGQQ